MQEFLNDIDSIYWWLSVVLVGLIINIASSYLKKPIDIGISKISETWKSRIEQKQNDRQELISNLRRCDRSFYHYCMLTTENQLRAIQNLILSAVLAAFGLIASEQYPGIEIIGYVGGAFFYFNGLRLQANKNEAKSIISEVLASA